MIIYKITNLKNNKIYVGLTTLKSAQHRFNKHVSEAKNTNENRYFLNAIRKYGKENFKLYNQKIIVKISKYNLKKEYLCTYNSISELLNSENIDRSGLWRYLKTNKFENNKGYKGFLYKKE